MSEADDVQRLRREKTRRRERNFILEAMNFLGVCGKLE